MLSLNMTCVAWIFLIWCLKGQFCFVCNSYFDLRRFSKLVWSAIPSAREFKRNSWNKKEKKKCNSLSDKKEVFVDIPTIVIPKVQLKIVTLPLSLSVIKSSEWLSSWKLTSPKRNKIAFRMITWNWILILMNSSAGRFLNEWEHL